MKIIQMIIEKYYNRMLRIYKVYKYEPPLNSPFKINFLEKTH